MKVQCSNCEWTGQYDDLKNGVGVIAKVCPKCSSFKIKVIEKDEKDTRKRVREVHKRTQR